ncbi:MAG: TonB-dependent receptor, partial [Flavobacteriaceae bacterium]|nr:TonB-dependent receptor [Flavobacteriaceae bacterium]
MKKTLTIFAALVTTILLAQQTQENDSILVTDLDEVVVVGGGVIDLAADRVTPVAANTITAEDLAAFGIGNVEIGESLKMVPGIYFASNAGFGDAEMFLRGFGMENTALMVNGQPVNSVEDGLVYWSNWSGMADVSQGIEVQRGLGASKLAISSVGGTINIITKTTEAKKGGF